MCLAIAACALLSACGDDTAQTADTSAPSTGTFVNSPPQITGIPAATATPGTPYSFRPAAADANNDPLTFVIDNRPPWATFSSTTGELAGMPVAGTYDNVVIRVSDGQASAQLPAFSIIVSAAPPSSPPPQPSPNRAPTITGTPPLLVTAGTLYAFTPTATAADGGTLTFTITNQPSWASFNSSTGRLAGTPTVADVGTESGIVISVSDGEASAQLPTFSIAVSAAPSSLPPNHPPTISGSPPTSILQGTPYSFAPTADDADGDELTFSIVNSPAWASFSTSTGRLQGTPGPEHVGTSSGILISAADGAASVTLSAFSITVQATALGSATLSWTPPTTYTNGSPLNDLEGYKVYWGTSPGDYPSSVTLDNPGLTSYVVENLVPGTYFFVMTALNAPGAESQHSNSASKTLP